MLLFLTYAALLLALSAALSALVLTQEFAAMGIRSARHASHLPGVNSEDVLDAPAHRILTRYNEERSFWELVAIHRESQSLSCS